MTSKLEIGKAYVLSGSKEPVIFLGQGQWDNQLGYYTEDKIVTRFNPVWGCTPVAKPKLDFPLAKVMHGSVFHPTMGLDPEFFIGLNGIKAPAFHFLSDKHTTKNDIFWDGYQAETRVAPDECHELLAFHMYNQFKQFSTDYPNLEILPGAVWRVPDEHLQSASEAEVALGCDPSYNAYNMKGKVVTEPRKLRWRFSGGHIHFRNHMKALAEYGITPETIVWSLDLVLGVASVALAQNYDSWIRRKYYGLAGEYRLPPHGLEYRTLSNFWVLDPQVFQLVLDLARWAFNLAKIRQRRMFLGTKQDVVSIINSSDVRSAKDLVKLNKDAYNLFLDVTYANPNAKTAFWKAIESGADSVVPDFGKNILKTWLTAGFKEAKPQPRQYWNTI